MAGKQDWLDAGMEILAEHGAPALTIERLVTSLGLTKGSFYHHFGSLAGFRTALLGHFEAEFTTRYIDRAEDGSGSPRERLGRLLGLVVSDERPDVGVAVRAWAAQDAEVRAVQERVDRTRIGYLRSLYTELTGDARQAAWTAQLLYLTLIGAKHCVPPVSGEELRALYEFTLRQLPGGEEDS